MIAEGKRNALAGLLIALFLAGNPHGALLLESMASPQGPPTYVPSDPIADDGGWGPAAGEEQEAAADSIQPSEQSGDPVNNSIQTPEDSLEEELPAGSSTDFEAHENGASSAPSPSITTSEETEATAAIAEEDLADPVDALDDEAVEDLAQDAADHAEVRLHITDTELEGGGVQTYAQIEDSAARIWRLELSAPDREESLSVVSPTQNESQVLGETGVLIGETPAGEQSTALTLQLTPTAIADGTSPTSIRWTLIMPVD